LYDEALRRLRERLPVIAIHTAGDGGDHERICALIGSTQPSILVAAGGDGTVHAAVRALMATRAAPVTRLGILPFGTGNNVARGLGLPSLAPRSDGVAIAHAVATVLDGAERCIDLGRAGESIFVGSFAVGMDGAILAARNRWRRRWRRDSRAGGYALYLVSCAVNLARQRAVAAQLHVDGATWAGPLYDLVCTNTPLYAGEFRFDAGDHSADGRLDLQLIGDPLAYVRAFVAAWRRHVHHERGDRVQASTLLQRVQRIAITLSHPLPAQLDGEEHPAAAQFEVAVLPQALRVCVRRASTPSLMS
jgi:diacylglycerol kinase (ATP)